jgi:hypothetical protein
MLNGNMKYRNIRLHGNYTERRPGGHLAAKRLLAAEKSVDYHGVAEALHGSYRDHLFVLS